MDKDRIVEIIKEVSEPDDFTGGVDALRITNVEQMLKVKLPESYKWFLSSYGHGGIGGIEILGVSRAEIPACVRVTEKYRQFQLPEKFVVVENCDEWLYCLDTSQLVDGECPVVDWDRQENIGIRSYKSFDDFLQDRFTDVLDNM